MAEKTKAPETALFKNHTQTAQIFYDVEIEGYVHDRLRVLPGSKIELPVAFGRKNRHALTEIKVEKAEAK
jgi:hypothetical protein